MVEQLLDRLIAFGLSIPTNLVILLIVCIIMKAMGKKSLSIYLLDYFLVCLELLCQTLSK